MADDLDGGWQLNEGSCPPRFIGTERRVFVELRNGLRPLESWRAHGRGACDWVLTSGPRPKRGQGFEIAKWREAK